MPRIRCSLNRLDVVTFLRHGGAVGAGDRLLDESPVRLPGGVEGAPAAEEQVPVPPGVFRR